MLFLFREGCFLFKVLELGWKLSTAPELAEEFLASETVTRTDSDSAQAVEAPVFSISETLGGFTPRGLQQFNPMWCYAKRLQWRVTISFLLNCSAATKYSTTDMFKASLNFNQHISLKYGSKSHGNFLSKPR